ncbi:DUF2789 family protein [Neptuniibacter sp.]|uniref:DUF2789 family protein n=1 Tax=Neptuniibacter sp. TaxID=1962643 RepID=UPI002636629B|nr:DUF2789 family protein [Neptuniibacter sp.]MCP4596364.1 DUF2789 domain-containing protein [Neptuniibacter sp.]
MIYYDAEIQNLFKELGLNSDPCAIDEFIEKNKILTGELHIADAPFWNPSQSEFIRDSLYYDSEWSYAVDQLDIILRN